MGPRRRYVYTQIFTQDLLLTSSSCQVITNHALLLIFRLTGLELEYRLIRHENIAVAGGLVIYLVLRSFTQPTCSQCPIDGLGSHRKLFGRIPHRITPFWWCSSARFLGRESTACIPECRHVSSLSIASNSC